jgi:adenylosuccinate lyase
LLAWKNLAIGLSRIAADEQKLRADLSEHWEVVSEGAQTILRSAGRSDAYELLKDATRGRVMTEQDYLEWLDRLDVDEQLRGRLASLTPETYVGLAAELVDRACQ